MFNFIKYFLNLILCLPLSSPCFRSSPEQVLNSGSKPSNHAFAKQSIKSWLPCFPEISQTMKLAAIRKQTSQPSKGWLCSGSKSTNQEESASFPEAQIHQSSRACLYSGSKSTNQAKPACIPEANRPIKQSLLVFRKQIDQSSGACLYSGSKLISQAGIVCIPEDETN
jgi:hypothetical protein